MIDFLYFRCLVNFKIFSFELEHCEMVNIFYIQALSKLCIELLRYVRSLFIMGRLAWCSVYCQLKNKQEIQALCCSSKICMVAMQQSSSHVHVSSCNSADSCTFYSATFKLKLRILNHVTFLVSHTILSPSWPVLIMMSNRQLQ